MKSGQERASGNSVGIEVSVPKIEDGRGLRKGKYSVKAIQRQTVVGRDRDAVLSLPSFGALECRDTHLGSEIPSQMPNVHSAWEGISNRSKTASLSLLRQGLSLDRFH